MNQAYIFLPSVALVALTYIVLLYMFKGRVMGIRKHKARMQELADQKREAEIFSDSVNTSDNFENLFEMPVLFYVVSIIIFLLSKVDGMYLALAWIYVFSRYAHSYVHCTSNRVKYRFRLYALSVMVLFIIWVRLAIQILI